MRQLFRQEPFDLLTQECAEEGEHTLKRVFGPWRLTALGIGTMAGVASCAAAPLYSLPT